MNKKLVNTFTAAAVLVLVGACSPEPDSSVDIEYFTSPATEGMNLPFAASVRVGNVLYLSGNIGNLPGTLTLAPGGIEAETRQTMENIKSALGAAGATMDQVVKCTIFIADVAEWGAFNKVYAEYFERPPARSTTGANGLALGARIEIECMAVIQPSARRFD